MKSCEDRYARWLVLECELESMEEACDTFEKQWSDNLHTALENFTRPELFLKNLIKGQKGFDAYLECRQDRDAFLNAGWSDAMDEYWECIEDHAHHDPA